jgi:N-acetylneuraminate synthase
MSFKISNITISNKNEPLIIAELGINHNGSLERAINIADQAIKSGARVIKHQTHIVDDEYSYHAKKIKPGNSNKNIYKIIKDCSLNEEDEFKLMNYIKKKNKIFISTPFSLKAVDRLIKFKVPAFKVGSGECNNHILLEYIAKQKKPIILSTGMNDMTSVKKSVNIVNKYHNKLALLHCTNVYPSSFDSLRLNSILDLRKKYKKNIIGYSDHSIGIYPSIIAMSLGALIIEKHFVENKKFKGPDVICSMDPSELQELIKVSKIVRRSVPGHKYLHPSEIITSKFAFASLVASKNINKNDLFTLKNICPKRPGTGDFLASDYKKLLGKKSKRNISVDEQIKKTDV